MKEEGRTEDGYSLLRHSTRSLGRRLLLGRFRASSVASLHRVCTRNGTAEHGPDYRPPL